MRSWLVPDVGRHSTVLESVRRQAGQRSAIHSNVTSSRSCLQVSRERPEFITVTLLKYHADKYFSYHSKFFLPFLIACDLARHLPGIEKLLALSPEFRRVHGSNIGYAISYVNVKQEPILEIALFFASSALDGKTTLNNDGRSKADSGSGSAKLDHALRRSLRSGQAADLQFVHSTVYRGGARAESIFYGLSKSDLELPTIPAEGASSAGTSKWRRRKARDDQGRELETRQDAMDEIVSRALAVDLDQGLEVDVPDASVESETDDSDSDSSFVAPASESPAPRRVETVFDRIERFAKTYEVCADCSARHPIPEADDS